MLSILRLPNSLILNESESELRILSMPKEREDESESAHPKVGLPSDSDSNKCVSY
jgi:hypothetical protein